MSKFLFCPPPVATGTDYKIRNIYSSIFYVFILVIITLYYFLLIRQYYIRQAVEAKQRLLEIIEEKVKERKCEFLKVFHDNKGMKSFITGCFFENIILTRLSY